MDVHQMRARRPCRLVFLDFYEEIAAQETSKHRGRICRTAPKVAPIGAAVIKR